MLGPTLRRPRATASAADSGSALQQSHMSGIKWLHQKEGVLRSKHACRCLNIQMRWDHQKWVLSHVGNNWEDTSI